MKTLIVSTLLFAAITIAALVHGQMPPPQTAFLKSALLKTTQANGIELAYREFGEASQPPVLMIMGLGGSHMLWGDPVVQPLVDAGYRVIVFDNRDVGASQHFDEHGDPWLWWEFAKMALGFEVDAAYTLNDMAGDAVGLMDALDIEQAHIVGASMGGMIAQVIAAQYPERAMSLTSIMSSTGAPHLPQGGPSEDGQSLEDLVGEDGTGLEAYGLYPESMPRQLLAIIKTGDRSDAVAGIEVPTLILHGKKDNVLPLPHGEHTAELIQGARFVVYDEMAHDFPPAVLPQIIGEMTNHFVANGP